MPGPGSIVEMGAMRPVAIEAVQERRELEKVATIDMDGPAALFAYGSLQPRGDAYSLIASYVRAEEEAMVRGVLYDLGEFPALGEGNGVVHGRLLHLDVERVSQALAHVDRYEGYAPEALEDSLYVRNLVRVQISGGEYTAWAYLLNEHCVMLPPLDRLPRW